MFSAKCANTSCGAAFDFRRGRLFRIDVPHSNADSDASHFNAAHFWLCDRCSVKYTVEFAGGDAVLLKTSSPHLASRKGTQELARASAGVASRS